MSPLTHLHDPGFGRGYMPSPSLIALSIFKRAHKPDAMTYLHIALDSERSLYHFETDTINRPADPYWKLPGVTVHTCFTKSGAHRKFVRVCNEALEAGWQLQVRHADHKRS